MMRPKKSESERKIIYDLRIILFFFSYFRSGIQTLPHNAKVHYNYGNFLKDSGRHDEAIHHYNTALRFDSPCDTNTSQQ